MKYFSGQKSQGISLKKAINYIMNVFTKCLSESQLFSLCNEFEDLFLNDSFSQSTSETTSSSSTTVSTSSSSSSTTVSTSETISSSSSSSIPLRSYIIPRYRYSYLKDLIEDRGRFRSPLDTLDHILRLPLPIDRAVTQPLPIDRAVTQPLPNAQSSLSLTLKSTYGHLPVELFRTLSLSLKSTYGHLPVELFQNLWKPLANAKASLWRPLANAESYLTLLFEHPSGHVTLSFKLLHNLSNWGSTLAFSYSHLLFPLLRPLVSKPCPVKEMLICFRYMLGERHLSKQTLKFPSTLQERFLLLSKSLGLSFQSQALSIQSHFPYSSLGKGLLGVVNNIDGRKLVFDAFTTYDGFHARFIVLISLGVGCTVWYTSEPTGYNASSPHYEVLFTKFSLLEYAQSFIHDFDLPGFEKFSFVETKDVTPSVASAMTSEHPFCDIKIPATLSDIPIPDRSTVLKGVALGVMVVFFLTVGITPDFSDE